MNLCIDRIQRQTGDEILIFFMDVKHIWSKLNIEILHIFVEYLSSSNFSHSQSFSNYSQKILTLEDVSYAEIIMDYGPNAL